MTKLVSSLSGRGRMEPIMPRTCNHVSAHSIEDLKMANPSGSESHHSSNDECDRDQINMSLLPSPAQSDEMYCNTRTTGDAVSHMWSQIGGVLCLCCCATRLGTDERLVHQFAYHRRPSNTTAMIANVIARFSSIFCSRNLYRLPSRWCQLNSCSMSGSPLTVSRAFCTTLNLKAKKALPQRRGNTFRINDLRNQSMAGPNLFHFDRLAFVGIDRNISNRSSRLVELK